MVRCEKRRQVFLCESAQPEICKLSCVCLLRVDWHLNCNFIHPRKSNCCNLSVVMAAAGVIRPVTFPRSIICLGAPFSQLIMTTAICSAVVLLLCDCILYLFIIHEHVNLTLQLKEKI